METDYFPVRYCISYFTSVSVKLLTFRFSTMEETELNLRALHRLSLKTIVHMIPTEVFKRCMINVM